MNLDYEFKNGWKVIKEMNNMENVMKFSKEYIDFLNKSKTERLCAREIIKQALAQGFISIEEAIKKGKVEYGDKIFVENKDKGVALFVIGEKDIEKGMKIIASHIDSPRLDLKQNPLYEDDNLAYFKTHYYGGIKKYQWVSMPLALYGVVVLSDGTKVDIAIGDDEEDPVFCISDLLPHLSSKQNQKKLHEAIGGEDLNVLMGSIPFDEKENAAVKYNMLKLLNEKYNMTEEDFLSAEIEVVPAGKARDLGLDKSMIISYGQDDRVCAFASIKSIFEIEKPEYTAVTLCVDKEETGSYGNTGMHSKFFENTVAELINLQGNYSDLKIKRTMSKSRVLSGDVNAAYDPHFSSVYEKANSAHMGKGVAIMKYSGSKGKSGTSDANAEFVCEVRRVFNKEKIVWQTGELGKVDQGGGGTVAYILANYGAEVLDCGIALLSMHAPYEVSSKVDVFEMYRGYKAFFNINL
ncbi:aminopeptidase [Terrisporobacter sp.]